MSGIFDDPVSPMKYFTIVQNIGNYTPDKNQTVSLSDLQLIEPQYFGKTHLGDYEKQLENMEKRPTVSYV